MKTCLVVLAFTCYPLMSQTMISPESLLDRMTGTWILRGTIAGQQTTHDVTVEWMLQRQYLQLREISREKDSLGRAAYEARVIIGWNQRLNQYGCLWLDNTGVWDFSAKGIGHGKPGTNQIAFLFASTDTSAFHTTFVYDDKRDAWNWLMDDDEKGTLIPFARVTLTRK